MSKPSQLPRYTWPVVILLALGVGGVSVWDWLRFNDDSNALNPPPPREYKAEVIKSYPHDPEAFTQGLIFHDGFLYESTGIEEKSTVRKVDLETGEILLMRKLERFYFGEGLTLWKDRLLQLTWQHGKGFVYELDTFKELKTFSYRGEGWGLTHDGKHLIMSDGTHKLRFLDPETFESVRTLEVRNHLGKLPHLNELEFIKGEIYANVYYSDEIVRISPETGHVIGAIDCSGLLTQKEKSQWTDEELEANVLNGIAYDQKKGRLFITGKNWPRLFEIQVIEK